MNLKKAGIFFAFILAFNTILSQPLKLVLPIGHTRPNGINKQQFSPDGKYVITSSEDMTVKIWDVCSGKLLHNLTGHTGIVATVEYLCSPGGTTVATLDPDGVYRLWNIQSGQLHFSITPASSRAAWGFDGNDTTLFILDQSGKAWQYSPRKKKLLYTIPGYSGDAILNAALSHDLKYLAVYKNNGPLTIFSKTKGTKIKDFPASTGAVSIQTLLFSPDDSFICAGYFDNSIHLWHTKTFQHKWIDSIYQARYSSVITFSNSENNFAFMSPGDEVVICTLPDLSISHVFPPLQRGINEIQFCGNQKLLVSGFDSTLTVWDYSNGTKLHEFKEFGDLPGSVDYDEKNDYFLAGIWNKTTGIWRGDNYEPVQFLKGASSTIIDYDVNHSKKIVLTAGDDGIVRLWDIVNGRITRAYPAHNGEVSQISFFNNGKQFITTSMDGSVKKWDVGEKKPLLFMDRHEGGVKSAALYKKDSVILSLAHDQNGLPRIWDSNNGRLLFDIKQGDEFIDEAGYSPDDKYLYTISFDSHYSFFRVYDVVTREEIWKLREFKAFFRNPYFDNPGTKILLSGVGRRIWILDAITGKLLQTINTGAEWLMDASFTDGHKKVISRERYGDIRIWDSNTGALVDSFHVNTDELLYSRISNSATKMLLVDKSRNVSELQIKERRITKDISINPVDYSLTDSLLFICDEAEMLMFNLPKGKFIASFINVDTDASLVLLPNGYYFGDKSSTQKLHYVKNGRIITFDQLDIKFNRPDLVLAAIGNTDTVLLRSYRNAWEKRIKKLGIDTSFFRENYTVPETEFEGRNSIGYEQNEKLRLHIKSTDKKSSLDRFNIWINEVPLFGIRGISIKERKTTFFDTTLSVRLSRGKNIIETSVTNLNGVESYREPLTVYYNPPFPEQQIAHFIGIGIDLYANSQYNLQYSAKDIRDLAVKLKEKYGENITIDTLFNQNVTVENVRSLKNKLLTTGVNDKVIVAYSGHGLLNKDFDYYLSTYQVNFDKPEENGLSYNELENLLDKIPARKKLMLIDACHSGEVDKDELVRLADTPDSLVKGLQPVAFKKDENNLGLKNSFELMQNIFVNVGKSTGAIVISAAAGTQFALERNDLKNGVFSFCILEAMNNYPTMKVSELKKIIGEKVEQITNGLQKPTYRNEAIAVDWNIW